MTARKVRGRGPAEPNLHGASLEATALSLCRAVAVFRCIAVGKETRTQMAERRNETNGPEQALSIFRGHYFRAASKDAGPPESAN
jgi:hypothetical protein